MGRRGVFLKLDRDSPQHRVCGCGGHLSHECHVGVLRRWRLNVGRRPGRQQLYPVHRFLRNDYARQPTYQSRDGIFGGGGQTLDAGSYLLFITNPTDLALPEYLNDGKGIFIINQPLADGATYKPIGNGFDLGVALSNSVPEPSTWAMMLVGFAGLGYAGYRRAREPRAAT